MQKLGQWQKCQNDVVAGGSKHLHGVSIGSGVRYTISSQGDQRTLELEAVDTPVINLGEPLGFPVPCEKVDDPWGAEPDLEQFGVSSLFWNNLWVLPAVASPWSAELLTGCRWGTNYVRDCTTRLFATSCVPVLF